MKQQKTVNHNNKTNFITNLIARIGLKGLCIIAMCFVLVIASSVGVYAWFMRNYETPATTLTTGDIALSFQSYKYGSVGGTDSLIRYLNWTSTTDAVSSAVYDALQKDVGIFADAATDTEPAKTDDVYFVIKKESNCIPVDIRLALKLTGLKNHTNYIVNVNETDYENMVVTYVGGYYYQLEEITDQVMPYTTQSYITQKYTLDESQSITNSQPVYDLDTNVTNIEQGIYRYITNGAANGGTPRNLSSISGNNTENESHTLRDSDYCIYRLTTGIEQNASQVVNYSSSCFNIDIKLQVIQKDGFLSHGTSQTYYVANETQLKNALNAYAPGDSIVLTGDIDFNGDLVLSKPVSLYLNSDGGKKLTIHGNFVISYPYDDTFTINTEYAGQIIVKKVNNAEGTFRVDLPEGNLMLIGEGDEGVGLADYYVQSQIYFKASCIPVTNYSAGTSGYGITLNKVSIRQGTGADDQEQILHPIRLGNDTQLTISSGTVVGKIYPNHNEEAVERIVIINYGTIQEQIDLSNMTVVAPTAAYSRYRDDCHAPQIFIDNFGTIAKNGTAQAIRLPSQAAKFYYDAENDKYCGNTRIIQERSCIIDMAVVMPNSIFVTSDIEKIAVNQNVVDVNQDGKNLIIYYADFTEEHNGVTIQRILTEHINKHGTGTNYNNTSLSQINKLTIIYQGTELTDADYTFLHSKVTGTNTFNFSNLTELDLSGAYSQTKKIPADAFNGMSSLTKVSIPADTTEIGNSAFVGTSIKDLYLGKNTTTIGTDALGSIRAIHISNPTVLTCTNSTQSSDNRRLFLETDTLLSAYESVGYTRAYLFKEATWLEGSDVYYRFRSGTDADLACYVGPAWTDTVNTTLTPNMTFSINVGGKDYSIVSIDAYAFCNKITKSNATELFTPQFSDRLGDIGEYAFTGCTALGENVDVKGCQIIDYRCFYGCTFLKQIIGNAVTTVGGCCFEGCTRLQKACFPNAQIGYRAFIYCTKLISLESTVLSPVSQYLDNVQIYIVHPESSNAQIPNYLTYNMGVNQMFRVTPTSTNYVVLANETIMADDDYSYYQYMINKTQASKYPHIIGTAEFVASEYVYTSVSNTSATEVRYSYLDDGETKYLEDLGYGDYVWGIRDDGNGGKEAVLIACLLQKIRGNYQVPDTMTYQDATGIHTYPVVEINKRAFQRTAVEVAGEGTIATTITFGNNLRTIGGEAFKNKAITGALDLNNVTSIGSYTFSGTGITSANLGKVSTMGTYAFYNCDSLIDLDCEDCTIISEHAFDDCEKLLYAKGEDVLTIGAAGFYLCKNLIQATFPNALLREEAFRSCYKLLVLETAVFNTQTGHNYVIDECTSLKLWIIHPESNNSETLTHQYTYGVGCVGNSAYLFRTSNVPGYVLLFSQKTPEDQAFYDIANSAPYATHIYSTGNFEANDYYFTSGTTNGNYTTFSDGTTMRRLSYLTNCEGQSYGDYVWGLDSVNHTATLLMSLVPTIGNTTNATTYGDLPEYVYRTEDDGTGNMVQVAYAVTTLKQNCFANTSFTNCDVLIPDNLRTVEDRVFLSKGITGELHLKNVTTVGSGTFQETSITKAYLGKISTMGNYAFHLCNSLAYVDCEQATLIGISGFSSCSALTTVEFQGDDSLVQTISQTAFASCTALARIEANKTKTVGISAFMNCTTLTECILPECTTLSISAFSGDIKLETVFSPKVNIIYKECFLNCEKLANVTITACTTIQESAFENCRALVGILIPNVVTIGKKAFYACTALEVIKGPVTTSVGQETFSGCSLLREALFPNASLSYRAFYNCATLAVLESTVYYTKNSGDVNAVIRNCPNLRYWFLNTESTNAATPSMFTYSFDTNVEVHMMPSSTQFNILVSEKLYGTTNYYIKVKDSSSTSVRLPVVPTQQFTANQYIYYSVPDDTTYTRWTASGANDIDGNPVVYHMSDMDAGDYVFGYKGNDEVVLLACLLKEIKPGYQVPDTITVGTNTYRVTEINDRAYYRVSFASGATVSFGDNLIKIGGYAFYNRPITGTLNLNNVTTIGESAFSKAQITTLGLGHTATIGTNAFSGITTLQTLNCDYASVISSGDATFRTIPFTTLNCCHITSIGTGAFMNNRNITTINFDDVVNIGSQAFYTDSAITTVTMPNVKTISSFAFIQCSSITTLSMPNVTYIGPGAFDRCSKLQTVTFGAIEQIDYQAFLSCIALTSIDLGTSILSVGYQAFTSCSSLHTVNLGPLTSIQHNTFNGCSSLQNITMNSVKGIGENAFYNCILLDCVDMPEALAIGLNAFENCPLTTLHLGKVNSIGTDAFKGTTIENLYCDRCTLIETDGFNLFSGKLSLQFVDLGNVTKVGTEVFKGCTNLETLVVGSTCTEIGDSAFNGCTHLSSMTWTGNTLKVFGASAFDGDINLSGSYDFSSVTSIGASAFNNCALITGAVDLSDCTTLGANAFTNTNITSLTLGNGITTIGDETFKGCTELAIVSLGQVQTMGASAFQGCQSIKTLSSTTLTKVGVSCFSGCSKLIYAKFPMLWDFSHTAYNTQLNTFANCTSLIAVETAFPQSNATSNDTYGYILFGLFYNDTAIRAWILHPENNPNEISTTLSLAISSDGRNSMFQYNGSLRPELFRIILPTTLDANSPKTITDYFKQGRLYGAEVIDLGMNNTFYWADATDNTNATRVQLDNNTKYLSDYNLGDFLYYLDNDSNATLVSCFYDSIATSYTVPATLGGNTVIGVGTYGYYHTAFNNDLELNIEDSIASIGSYAFYSKNNLHSVTLGNSVKTIGDYAFYNDKLDSALDLNEVTTIGTYAFYNTGITSLDCGSALRILSQSSFEGCSSLASVDFGIVTTINNSAFKNCTSLLKAESDYVITVKSGAFMNCTSLVSVKMPYLDDFGIGNTRNGTWYYTFYNCSRLVSLETAFPRCPSTSRFWIGGLLCHSTNLRVWIMHPENTTYTCTFSISGNGGKTYPTSIFDESWNADIDNNFRIVLASNIKNKLYDLQTVEQLTTPSTTTQYYWGTGSDHTGETRLQIGGQNLDAYGLGDYLYYLDENNNAVIVTSLLTRMSDNYSVPTRFYLDSTDTTGRAVGGIGPMAYYHVTCNTQTALTVGDDVVSIGNQAFQNLSGISSLALGTGLRTIGDNTFAGTSISGVLDLKGTTSIGTGNFAGSSITSLIAPSLISVASETFKGCNQLTTVTLNSVTSIGDSAFEGDHSLSSVSLSSCITIGDKAFYDCYVLSSVDFGTTQTIGEEAFKGCTALTNIVLGSAQTIGVSAFEGCTSLVTAQTEEVVTFNDKAFYNCTSLTTVDLDSCTTLGDNVFALTALNCAIDMSNITAFGTGNFAGTNITSLNCGHLSFIPSESFKDCKCLTEVDLGDVANLGDKVFSGCTALATLHLGNLNTFGTAPFAYCPVETLYCDNCQLLSDDSVTFPITLTNIKTIDFGALTGISANKFYSGKIETVLSWGAVTTIGDSAFRSSKIQSVDFRGSQVTTIGTEVFRDCKSLVSCYLGTTPTNDYEFYNCTSLVTVDLGTTDTLHRSCFHACPLIDTIDLANVTTIEQAGFHGATIQNFHLGVLASTTTDSINCTVTTLYLDNNAGIQDGTLYLGGSATISCKYIDCCEVIALGSIAFNQNNTLEAINFRNVETIGSKTFYGTALKNTLNDDGTITIGLDFKNVTTIGNSAFYQSGIETVNFRNVETIEPWAFYHCTKLKNTLNDDGTITNNLIDLKDVQTLGEAAFRECTSIVLLDLASITFTGTTGQTFYGCTSLEAVNFANVTTLQRSCFQGCTKLKNTLNDDGTITAGLDLKNVTSFGSEGDFMQCTSLEEIYYRNLTSAGSRQCFLGCTALTTIHWGAVQTIGNSVFSGCTSLIALDFRGTNVTTINGQYAFMGCTGIQTIYFGTVTTLSHHNMFENCTSLATIDWGNMSTISGNNIFKNCTSLTTLNFNSANPIIFNDCSSVFSGCINIESIDCGSVVSFGSNCYKHFEGCTKLETINFRNVTTLCNSCFKGCTNLEVVESDIVTYIGKSCFDGCSNLVSVKMPYLKNFEGAKNSYAADLFTFANCPKLTVLETAFPNYTESEVYLGGILKNSTNILAWIVHPENTLSSSTFFLSYLNNPTHSWAIFGDSSYISNANNRFRFVTSTGGRIGYSCQWEIINIASTNPTYSWYSIDSETNATRYTVKDRDGVDRNLSYYGLGDYLYYVDNGNSVLVSSFLDSIVGDYTTPSTMDGNNVTSILDYAHVNWTTNVKLTFADTVTTIGDSAFAYNTKIDEIDFRNVTTLCNSCFKGCTNLEVVESDIVTYIGKSCFDGCSNLVSVKMPYLKNFEGAKNGFAADLFTFANCPKLTVLETAFPNYTESEVYLGGILKNSTNILAWIVHPENTLSSSTFLLSYNNNPTHTWAIFGGSSISNANNRFRFVISTGGRIGSSCQWEIINTGTNTTYYWGNASIDSGVRLTVEDTSGTAHNLSYYGLGDFLYYLDGSGKAVIVSSFIESSSLNYQTPSVLVDTATSNNVIVSSLGNYSYAHTEMTEGVNLKISEGTTTIGSYAFSYPANTNTNTEASIISLPSTVTTIGDYAFSTMQNVGSIKLMPEDIVNYNTITANYILGSTPSITSDFTVYVRKSMLSTYRATSNWGNVVTDPANQFQPMGIIYTDAYSVTYYLDRNTDGTYTITDMDVPGAYSSTSLVMLSSYVGDDDNPAGIITNMRANVFAPIKNFAITSITLPDYLASIDNLNLIIPVALESFVISSSNTSFETEDGILYTKGKTVLLICPVAKSGDVVVSNAISAIAIGAFRENSSLTSITIAQESAFNGYLFVATGAFDSCTNLTTVSFGKTVIMSDLSFTNCEDLTQVNYTGVYEPIFLSTDIYDNNEFVIETITPYVGA